MTLRILREWREPPAGAVASATAALLSAFMLCLTKLTRNLS